MKKRRRLKHKIISVMMPMTIFLMMANSLYHYDVTKEALLKDFESSQLNAEAHIVDTLYLIDAGYRMLEIKLEGDLNEKADSFLKVYDEAQGQVQQKDLEALKKSYGNAYDFMVIDRSSTIIQSTLPEGLGFNFSKFSPELGMKINAIREGNVTWFEQLRTNVGTGKLSKFAYIPTGDHEVLLEVAYSIDGFTHMTDELKPHSIIEQMIDVSPQIKDIKIYDVYGYLYSDSGEKKEPEEGLLRVIERVKKEKVLTLAEDEVLSRKYLYVDLNQYRNKTLANTDRIIEILYDKTIINDSLADLKFTTLAGIMIISLFLVMSILYLSNRLTKPIEVLKIGAQKVASGDYSSRVNVVSNDEVGELAEAFNHMAEELNMSFSRIEGQNKILEDYNRNLEIKVAERTQEIESRNLELESANSELELAWIKANEATQSKSHFLAMMSHEIRTPINAMVGMTYLMFRTKLDNRQKDYVQKIQNAAEDLLEIVNDVLDISKLEAGKTKLEAISFDLESVFEIVSNQVGFKAAEKQIELVIANDPLIPKNLIGDPLRLRQVLLNLLNNAVKFTDKGAILVETQLAGQNEAEIKIRFSVKDTGIGIEPKKAEKLFEPFQQADDTITRKYGGTGLGLSLCKHFVQLMSGEIWVESKPNEGSTFYFTGIFKKGQKQQEANLYYESLKALKLLIVDDSEITREVLVEMLKNHFGKIVTAISGEEAIEKIRESGETDTAFDMILMDWKMVGLDGLEASAEIKKMAHMKKVPMVLMLTGYDLDEAKNHEMSKHVDAFLSKPIIQNMLLATIGKLLGLASYNSLTEEGQIPKAHVFLEPLEEISILIAEDNLVNQQILRVLLEHPLFRIDMAPNGITAVQSARQYDYDLIFMDVQMPELDGLEATKVIRSEAAKAKLPIIAMTAHALEEDRLKCLEAGMSDFISKPINDIVLYEMMLRWMPHKKMELRQLDEPDQLGSAEFFIGLRTLNTKQPLINLRGDGYKYLTLLDTFKKQYGDAGLRMTALLLENHQKEALSLVHSLRGTAGNLGGMSLFVAAQTLEAQIQQGRVEADHPNVIAFKDELSQLLQEIDKVLTEKRLTGPLNQPDLNPMDYAQLISLLRQKLKAGMADVENLIPLIKDQFPEAGEGVHRNHLISQIKNFDYDEALISLEALENMKRE